MKYFLSSALNVGPIDHLRSKVYTLTITKHREVLQKFIVKNVL